MTYPIEAGIPMPESAGRSSRYPFDRMSVGDSFFVPAGRLGPLQTAASKAGARYARRFTAREVAGGCRVWRTE